MTTDTASDTAHRSIPLTSGAFWAGDPLADLAWARRHDPVHWDEAARVWGVTRYDDVLEVSKHPELFSNAQGIRPDTGPTSMLIDLDNPEHAKRRKLVNRAFTPNQVRARARGITVMADQIIDRVCERGECDFVMDVAAWLPLMVIGESLGFDEADYPALLDWSDALLSGLDGTPESMARMTEVFLLYEAYARRVIEARRQHPASDLMSVLVHAEVDGERLDDHQLLLDSLLILIGGDETTRHVISGGVYQLLRNRTQWDELVQDRGLLRPATEEMLRWVSPIKNMARVATADTVLAGSAITAGQKLLLLYPSANRDEAHFTDPDVFDIHRDPNDHLAFGFGSHFCLGNSLARLEITTMLGRLLDRLPDLHLAEPAEPPRRPANFVSGYESMPVTFTPSAPLGQSRS
ncbi:MAG TPA: cytochrome P450 [Acidimicrobiales bacterium]|nr:cytochrome P450 [Acidimicrobiales bacterium]